MDIKPNEIKHIKTIGTLNGDEVKLVGTHGGLWVAVGKRKKTDKSAESLAAASHSAIVAHQLEKLFDGFQPSMNKSEITQDYNIEDNTSLMTKDLQDKGFELFTLSKNEQFEFIVHRYGRDLGLVRGEVEGDKFLVEKGYLKENIESNPEIMKGLAMAMAKKKRELNIKEHNPKWT
jgi:hypothetical protein